MKLGVGMGKEVARATPPILQVENLSHHYWVSQPRACSQPSRTGRAESLALGGSLAWSGLVNHCALCEHNSSVPQSNLSASLQSLIVLSNGLMTRSQCCISDLLICRETFLSENLRRKQKSRTASNKLISS